MTREECLAKYHHQAWGIMLDCSRFGGSGAARSIMEDQSMRKLDNLIRAIYDDLSPKPAPEKPK
jgi:hypothetical protein